MQQPESGRVNKKEHFDTVFNEDTPSTAQGNLGDALAQNPIETYGPGGSKIPVLLL